MLNEEKVEVLSMIHDYMLGIIDIGTKDISNGNISKLNKILKDKGLPEIALRKDTEEIQLSK